MNHNIESNFYNSAEENDGETDNYVTCPLLQLKYSRQRKPITYRYVISKIIITVSDSFIIYCCCCYYNYYVAYIVLTIGVSTPF